VVNLVTGQVDTVQLGFDQSLHRVANALRVASNGLVFVTATIPGVTGSDGQLATFDLATATSTIRTDVGTAGAIDLSTRMARIGDRSRLLFVESVFCCHVDAYGYQPENDAFTSRFNLASFPAYAVQGASGGSRFLVDRKVYSRDFGDLGGFTDSSALSGSSALSADGNNIFLAGMPEQLMGYVVQSVATHAVLDRRFTPGWHAGSPPARDLFALPDGRTLLIYESIFPMPVGNHPSTLHIARLP